MPSAPFNLAGAFGMGASYDPQSKGFQWDPQFLAQLKASALGTGGPSQAEQLYQSILDRAAKRGLGLLATQRGLPPAAAARMGLQAQQAGSLEGAQQMAALRAQEQQQALGNMLAQQQAAQGGYLQNKGLDLQAQQFNAQQNQQLLGALLGGAGSLLGGFL